MMSVGIVGGSGYTGGELLRYLLNHREARVTQITSRENAGQFIHAVHPHLRGATDLHACRAQHLVADAVTLLNLGDDLVLGAIASRLGGDRLVQVGIELFVEGVDFFGAIF